MVVGNGLAVTGVDKSKTPSKVPISASAAIGTFFVYALRVDMATY
jgi:hypothetical protein